MHKSFCRIGLALFCLMFLGSSGLIASDFKSIPQDTTKTDTTEAEKKEKKRDLPLKPERTISFRTDEATWMSLDVSPNGQTILFELLGDLYTLPITGGEATRITSGLALDTQPRYSPDGKRIVFVSDRSGAENLWLLDVGFTITDTTAASDTTGLKPLTKGEKSSYASPEWTPDGKYVVASKGSGLGGLHLWMYHVDGGKGIDLFSKKEEQNRTAMGTAFGPDDRYIYFATKMGRWGYNIRRFQWQVALYDRDFGKVFPLTGEVGSGMRPAVSPDGKWLVYATRHDAKTGYRLRDLETGLEQWLAYPVQRDDQESRYTRDFMPGYSFTPDSKAIVTSSDGKLYRVDIPGGEKAEIPFEVEVSLELGPMVHFEKRVEDGPVQIRQIRWPVISPDGATLAFTAVHKLYVKDLASGKITRLAEMNAGQYSPAWSTDSKWLAFVTWSEEEGGHVYKVPARGGSPKRLSNASAYYADPVWTPDGEEVVVAKGPWQQRRDLSYFNFIGGQGMDLVRIPANGGAAVRIAPLRGIGPHFADKPDRIYVYEGREGLVSMRLDGTDRKVHVKVTGIKPQRPNAQPSPASMVVMGNDGEQALALAHNHIYGVTVPRIGEDPPSISILKPENAMFPVKKLTSVGGQFMNWAVGTNEATWSLGNTLFRYNFADAKAFEDSLKAAKRDEKKEDKAEKKGDKEEEEEKAYEPGTIAVELEMPRYKGKGTVVLRGARIITMATDDMKDDIVRNGAIVITDNRISQVGSSETIATPAGAREIDVSGKTIIPGLVDTHAHMWPAWGVHRGVVWEYLANLAYGVLTTHDPQTSTTDVLTYSDLAETGELIGPRVYYTGPGVFSSDQIKSLKDAKKVMKRYADYYHTNTIKQYIAGDRNTRQWIIMAAKEREIMPTTEGALDMKLDLTQIIDGYPGHEHSFPIAPLFNDVVELVAQSGTFYTPTLLVSYGGPWAENYYYTTTEVHDDAKLRRFVPHKELDKLTRRRSWFADEEHVFQLHAEQAKKIVEAGGRVCIGGHGQLQGLGYHWELWSVQSGGMSEMDALRCATIFGAEAIGFDKDLGSIEEGKLADLLVLDRNPLDDIRNTNSIRLVMKSGLLYDGDTLDQIWPEEKKLPRPYWWEEQGPAADGRK
jgi:Tol biopolymer transport system component